MIVKAVRSGHDCYYVPMIVRDRAVMFTYESTAIEFLQTVTGMSTQKGWSECDPRRSLSRDNVEGKNQTNFAIRPIKMFSSVTTAMEDYTYVQRQDALRSLTAEQRTLLGLPNPD